MKLDIRIPFTDVHIKGHDPATSTGPQAGMREWALGWIKVQAPRPPATDRTVTTAATFAPRVPLILPDPFDAAGAMADLNAPADHAKKDRAAPEYVNPNLGAVRSGGTKQYTFNGQPLLRSYAHGGPKDTTKPLREIGRGKTHAVHAKHNTQSPVLAKVAYRAVTDTYLQQARTDGRVMDDLAQVLLSAGDETTRRMSQHFAIELLKEIRDGRPTFYTQAVDGFTLEDYFANRDRYRKDLPSAAVRDKAKELLNAVEWLYGKGFVHLDMNFGNIMYDRASGKLVLIDFENVKRSKDNEPNHYELSLRLLRDGLAAELRSLGP